MKRASVVILSLLISVSAFAIQPSSYFAGAFQVNNVSYKQLRTRLSWSALGMINNALSLIVGETQEISNGPMWPYVGTLYIVKYHDQENSVRECLGVINTLQPRATEDERLVDVMCISQTDLFFSLTPPQPDFEFHAKVSGEGATKVGRPY